MFPIIGYPFGPGGYGRRLEVHFLLIRAKAIIIAATAKAGRVRPSDTNMVDGDRQWVETLRRRPRDQVSITSEFSALGPLKIGGEVRSGGRGKCLDTSFPAAAGNARTRPNLYLDPKIRSDRTINIKKIMKNSCAALWFR